MERRLENVYDDLAPAVVGYFRARGASDPEASCGDVFVRVAGGIPSFRGDDAALRRWVFTIAHNLLVDELKSARRRSEQAASVLPEPPDRPSVEALDPDLIAALRQLTPDQRAVLVLRYVADLPIRDVAKILGKRQGAVKMLQARGLADLEQHLTKSPATRDLSRCSVVHIDVDHELTPPDAESRLSALGREPISDEVRAEHLQRARTAAPEVPPAPRRFGPVAIAAAALVGFLAGSAGLASAGALPDSAQNVAHDVLGVVRVDVPEGRNRGACISEAAKLEDKEAKRAAKEACRAAEDSDDGDGDETPGKSGEAPGKSSEAPGKSGEAPGKSGEAPGKSGEAPGKSGEAPGQVKHADDPCRGRPPWAGPMSKEERAALKEANNRDACVDDAGDEPTEP